MGGIGVGRWNSWVGAAAILGAIVVASGCNLLGMSCSSIGCGPPIQLSATLRAREAMTATFCKGDACQSASFAADGTQTGAETTTALFSLQPTDTGVSIGVSLIREATYKDGEPLSFTVTAAAGGELLK